MHRNMQALFCDEAVAEFTVMQQNWQNCSKSSQLDESLWQLQLLLPRNCKSKGDGELVFLLIRSYLLR
jgi:hypothetical protein